MDIEELNVESVLNIDQNIGIEHFQTRGTQNI